MYSCDIIDMCGVVNYYECYLLAMRFNLFVCIYGHVCCNLSLLFSSRPPYHTIIILIYIWNTV